LLQEIQRQAQQETPVSEYTHLETTRGRIVHRQIQVFNNISAIDIQWIGIKSLIQVNCHGTREGKPFQQMRYYISSLELSAFDFAQGIQRHWSIENQLHWVKDVVLKEDSAPFYNYNAATNWSLMRNITLNLVRHNGYSSLTQAFRFISHDLDTIFSFFQ
jgi:predicted transposase YbfD/YdcC